MAALNLDVELLCFKIILPFMNFHHMHNFEQ